MKRRAKEALLPYLVLDQYIEEYLRCSSSPSPSGYMLQALQDGTLGCAGSPRNSQEDRLLSLCDRLPKMPKITSEELKVALAYHSPGGVVEVTGPGGYVVEVEATGASHQHAAKMLGYDDTTGPAKARTQYQRILDRIADALGLKKSTCGAFFLLTLTQ